MDISADVTAGVLTWRERRGGGEENVEWGWCSGLLLSCFWMVSGELGFLLVGWGMFEVVDCG